MASKSKTVFPPTLMPRFSCSVVFTWLDILPWKPFGKVLRNEPAIVCPMSTASPTYWHPHERPDHWQLCGGLRFGLSMGGNVLQVLTKGYPCRQIQASVAYYLPLCVWPVTKSWVTDQPRVHVSHGIWYVHWDWEWIYPFSDHLRWESYSFQTTFPSLDDSLFTKLVVRYWVLATFTVSTDTRSSQ